MEEECEEISLVEASHCGFYRDETLIVDLPCKAGSLKYKKVWSDILDKNDNVNHPEHYQGERECIDIMLDLFAPAVYSDTR